jgi:hypothetical protein
MMYRREAYEQWIQDYLKPRYPELVRDFRACLNGYERIKTNNRVDKRSLNSVFRAACSPRAPLFNTATGFLRELSAYSPEANEVILAMAADKHWYVRCHALLSLGQETPSDIVRVILQKSLQDQSSSVRGLAARKAQFLRVSKVIPDLENQLAIEPHPGTKYSIDFHLRLLRDGYFLERKDGDYILVWIPTNDGMVGRMVSQEDVDTKGINAIISKLRQNPYG